VELSEIAGESARGSFSLIVGTALSTFISAAVVIIMARLLGPDDCGLYTLAFAEMDWAAQGLLLAVDSFT
jgi:O-antigen/teichoic acid export membrane protein